MKKNYLFIGLIFLGFISSVWAVDVKIQVDLNSASDYYPDGGVWIMMDNNWTEYYDMVDGVANGIFEYTVSKDAGATINYKFSYQNGPDPYADYVVETVPGDCSNEIGLRTIVVPEANTALPAVVYGSCFEAGITIRVDLSERTDVHEGGAVWVYMDDNWEEYYDMMSSGGDIYYYTLQKDEGSSLQYSFSYQNGPDPDNDYVVEFVPPECANANGYRELTVPAGDTVLPAFLFSKCSEAGGVETPKYMTTFRVDMSDPVIIDLYDGGGVWLNINNWTDSYDMTDGDGDHIYTYELELDSGSTTLYKISYQYGPDPDQDYIDEVVPAACASPLSEWDREYKAAKDTVLPAFLVSSCGEYGDPGTEKFNVTFSVELGGDSVSTNSMWMVTKAPWSWREQTNTAGDVYSSSMKLFKDQTFPYTYVYGGKDNWSGEESVPPECNFGTETAPERRFEGTAADTVLPVIPFGECYGLINITYQVDMNNVSMAEGDMVWAHIYSPGDQWPEMTDEDEDGIYTVVVGHEAGAILEYGYSYGTDAIYDEETVPSECANEEGWRTYEVGEEDATLPSYLYGTCGVTSIIEFGQHFRIYPNPTTNHINIDLGDQNNETQISLTDLTGRVLKYVESDGQSKVTVPVSDLSAGLYLLQIKSGDNSVSKKILIGE